MREDELPVARQSDYESFRRAVGSDLQQQLAVETTTAGAPVPPADMKADDLVESARAAAWQPGNLSVAIALLKRATEVDPKNKYAWNNLGLAYFAEREDDQAISAFQKQLEVNPYDEFAYNNLGRVYWNERKYDDAAKAFNKQLEKQSARQVCPRQSGLDVLGVAQIRPGCSRTRKSGIAQPRGPGTASHSRHDAYLNLGQDDKALATFDHAIELSATPLVWNNIAYQLSLKGTHLDKAPAIRRVRRLRRPLRRCAISASTGSPSRIFRWSLRWSLIGTRSAGFTLPKAISIKLKYVSAAWGLGHHGEVGDHLAQIYEKRGEKDQALRTYALSMNGLRPTPETRDAWPHSPEATPKPTARQWGSL